MAHSLTHKSQKWATKKNKKEKEKISPTNSIQSTQAQHKVPPPDCVSNFWLALSVVVVVVAAADSTEGRRVLGFLLRLLTFVFVVCFLLFLPAFFNVLQRVLLGNHRNRHAAWAIYNNILLFFIYPKNQPYMLGNMIFSSELKVYIYVCIYSVIL